MSLITQEKIESDGDSYGDEAEDGRSLEQLQGVREESEDSERALEEMEEMEEMEDLVGSDEERLRQEFSRPKVEEGTDEGEDKVEDTLSEVLTGQPTPPAAPA
ncbi:unnamed protein product, partial [Polarella glacialis]